MANTIDSRIVLTAEDRASATIKGMARDLEHLSGTLRRAGSMITAVAGLGSITAFFRENMTSTQLWRDEMAKLDHATKNFFNTAANTGQLDGLVSVTKAFHVVAVGISNTFVKIGEGIAALAVAAVAASTGEFRVAKAALTSWKDEVNAADEAYKKFQEDVWKPAPKGFADQFEKTPGADRDEQAAQKHLDDLTRRLQETQNSWATEEELERQHFGNRLAILTEANQTFVAADELGNVAKLLSDEQFAAQREALKARHERNLTTIAEREAKRRSQHEQNAERAVQSAKMQTWQLAAGLVRAMAGESRAAALAVLAIEKGLAAAGVITNTEAAIARAEAELGPGAATPYVAKLRLQRNVSLALIAATGLAEAANVGGGGAEAGTPANPVVTTPAPSTPIGGVAPGPGVPVPEIVVIIQGNVIGQEQYIRDTLMPGFREELRRDGVLIPTDTLQYRMLRP